MKKLDYIYFQFLRKTHITHHFIKTHKTVFGRKVESGGGIYERLLEEEPCLIGRVGSSEMQAINACFNKQYGLTKKVSQEKIDVVCHNAGFFPNSEEAVWELFNEYIKSIKLLDVMAILENGDEDYIIEQFCPNATIIHLRALEPYYSESPWTKALHKKKVLVVHPFVETIKKQYAKRELLFANREILPEFELITIKAVQTIADNTGEFKDWFQALDYMKQQIDAVDFDIAILGCGAYALPLGAYIKSCRRKAVVLAGATQAELRGQDGIIILSYQNYIMNIGLDQMRAKNQSSLIR